jgi:hypothetical protein
MPWALLLALLILPPPLPLPPLLPPLLPEEVGEDLGLGSPQTVAPLEVVPTYLSGFLSGEPAARHAVYDLYPASSYLGIAYPSLLLFLSVILIIY